jgi:hypothetical protein
MFQALKPVISAGNISRIVTCTDEDKYDVGNEVISWQPIMKSIHQYCMQYDF